MERNDGALVLGAEEAQALIGECPHCGAKMFSDVEVCYACMREVSSFEASVDKRDGSDVSSQPEPLLDLFLVELASLISQFRADKMVGVKEPVAIVGEGASVRSVADEKLDP